mmetsp:Transcript_42370/g.98130  ORF Transcript_42370/g.98130 Transcript_42370/m.98130 type:complete len:247 (-) Transcript_42370:1521-2261(-)
MVLQHHLAVKGTLHGVEVGITKHNHPVDQHQGRQEVVDPQCVVHVHRADHVDEEDTEEGAHIKHGAGDGQDLQTNSPQLPQKHEQTHPLQKHQAAQERVVRGAGGCLLGAQPGSLTDDDACVDEHYPVEPVPRPPQVAHPQATGKVAHNLRHLQEAAAHPDHSSQHKSDSEPTVQLMPIALNQLFVENEVHEHEVANLYKGHVHADSSSPPLPLPLHVDDGLAPSVAKNLVVRAIGNGQQHPQIVV